MAAKKPAVTASKKPVKTIKPSAVSEARRPRRIKQAQYKRLGLSKRIKHPTKISSGWQLIKMSFKLLWQHKLLFAGITLVYGVLNLILVTGITNSTDVSGIKNTLQNVLGGGALSSSLAVFAVLVGSSGSGATAASSSYQLFLLLFVSLAVIWALREVMAGAKIRIRDAYYRGMYPLIPFILVLSVIALQLIPFIVGAAVYNIVISNGIAVYAAEKLLWGLLFGLLTLLSLYMTSSSVFALYIVTLPNMTPLRALRSARELVRNRRWTVLRKVLVLPVVLLLVAAAVMLPVILVAAPIAQWTFFVLTMFATAVVHTYLYMLYRELLNE